MTTIPDEVDNKPVDRNTSSRVDRSGGIITDRLPRVVPTVYPGASTKSSVVSYADLDTADPDAAPHNDATTIVPFNALPAPDPTIINYLLLERSDEKGGTLPGPITVTFTSQFANANGDRVLNPADTDATHITLVPAIDPKHENALNILKKLTNPDIVTSLAKNIGQAKAELNRSTPAPEGLRGGKKSKSKKHAKSKKQEKRKSVRRR